MALTNEDEQRQRAGIGELEARFKRYMLDRVERDQRQVIGRPADTAFDRGGDLKQQHDEKRAQARAAFREETMALERQNKDEITAFDDWMKEQRQRMRADDVIQRPQKAAPQPVPSFVQVPGFAQNVLGAQARKEFGQREKLRDEAAQTLRDRFGVYQSQQHDKRADRLNARAAQNSEQLDTAYERSVQQKASPEKGLKHFDDESDAEFAARTERAAKRAHEAPKLELKPKGPQCSF